MDCCVGNGLLCGRVPWSLLDACTRQFGDRSGGRAPVQQGGSRSVTRTTGGTRTTPHSMIAKNLLPPPGQQTADDF